MSTKKGQDPQINWGRLTDEEGRPISLSLLPGSTGDPTTLGQQVSSLRERFGIDSFTLVGDRGMITGKHIERFRFSNAEGIDLSVRPMHHRLLERVTAHFFICTLAYYVRWHVERAWASLTFADEHGADPERDPVAPAQRSAAATRKAQTGKLESGEPTHSFASLLADLATIQQTTGRERISGATFPMTTTPTAAQQHALDLLDGIKV